MIMFIYMYVCIYVLFDRVFRVHSCGGLIAYVGEWHEEVPSYEESSGQSSTKKLMRSISCGYELILCASTMPMFTLSTSNVERYISEMKTV